MKDVLCKYIAVAAIALMVTPLIAMANEQNFIPAGTRMLVSLETPISTEVNRPGDQFTASVVAPNLYGGAVVRGHISRIQPSGRFAGRTEMGLAFDSVEFPDGQVAQLNAELVDVLQSESVKMVDEEGDVISGRRGDQAIKRGGIGALAGGIIGGLIGGGRGLAIGILAGGAAGAGSLYFDRARELRLEPGAQMDIETVTPVGSLTRPPVLNRYDRGLVMDVQRELTTEGYYNGPINGFLDVRTRSAIGQFQVDNNLPVTRTTDRATVETLGVRY